MRSRSFRRPARKAPRPRAPTAAQIAASERAWNEADGSIEGRFTKGQIVLDHSGQAFKVTRPGRRYHEDIDNFLYPVKACRTPAPLAACERLRAVVDKVLHTGTHEPGSRGGDPNSQALCPTTEPWVTWRDRRPNSYAILPSVAVSGDYVRVVRYGMDGDTAMAWLKDKKLAKQVAKDIAASPQPVHVERVYVRLRGPAAAAYAIGKGLRALLAS